MWSSFLGDKGEESEKRRSKERKKAERRRQEKERLIDNSEFFDDDEYFDEFFLERENGLSVADEIRLAEQGGEEEGEKRDADKNRGQIGSYKKKRLYVKDGPGALDAFLESVYTYYLHGGFGSFLLARLTDILKLVFVGTLLYLTTACIDYSKLATALRTKKDESLTLNDFFVVKPSLPWYCYPMALVFCLYTIILTVRSVWQVRKMLAVRDFYQFELQITSVGAMRWSEILKRIIESKEMQSAGVGDSPLQIVARLMRQQNYFISLVQSSEALFSERYVNKSNLLLVFAAADENAEGEKTRQRAKKCRPAMTLMMEWILQSTLLSLCFPHGVVLRPEIARFVKKKRQQEEEDAEKRDAGRDEERQQKDEERQQEWQKEVGTLQNRFRLMAFYCAVLSPFIFCFLFVDFLLEQGQQYKTQPHNNVLVSRHWSCEARWKFRERDELPHYFRRRLARAHEPASKFLSMFPHPKTAIVARFLLYCFGSFVFLLLGFGLLFDDEALTNVSVFLGRSAIWWVSVLSAAIVVLRSYVPDENSIVFEPQKYLDETFSHLRKKPCAWVGQEHTSAVRSAFSRLFVHRWITTLCELASVLYTPYLLWRVFPEQAEQMLRFIVDNTVEDPQVGHIFCSASGSLAIAPSVAAAPSASFASAPDLL